MNNERDEWTAQLLRRKKAVFAEIQISLIGRTQPVLSSEKQWNPDEAFGNKIIFSLRLLIMVSNYPLDYFSFVLFLDDQQAFV